MTNVNHQRILIITLAIFLSVEGALADGQFAQPYSGKDGEALASLQPKMKLAKAPPKFQLLDLKKLPEQPINGRAIFSAEKMAEGLGVASRSDEGKTTIAPVESSVKQSLMDSRAIYQLPLKVGKPKSDKSRTVFYPDERHRISPTTTYPFRTFGLISMEYPNGNFACSGTLIGKRYVLTAAHCLFDAETGEWATHVTFYPGRDGDYAPYGGYQAKQWHIPSGYRQAAGNEYTWEHMQYDIGLIELFKPAGDTLGWQGYGYNDNLPKFDANIVGYPGDKAWGTMWRTSCLVDPIDGFPRFFDTQCDTYPGTSGSSTYDYNPADKSRLVLGVNIAENEDTNFSFRIDKVYFNWLGNLTK